MASTKRVYIDSVTLGEEALQLGQDMIRGGVDPQAILTVLRGGFPVALMVQRAYEEHGAKIPIFTIGSDSYQNEHESRQVRLYSTKSLWRDIDRLGIQNLETLAVADDIWQSGKTAMAVRRAISARYKHNAPSMPWGVVADKPDLHEGPEDPDYSRLSFRRNEWLVQPHEPGGRVRPEPVDKPAYARS